MSHSLPTFDHEPTPDEVRAALEQELRWQGMEFEGSTLEEIRTPTSEDDLIAIAREQRVMESLEQRYAEERFAKGRVTFIAVVRQPGQPVRRPVACLTMAEVQATQVEARKLGGW